ncbi:MAG: peptidylprolyl isomerase, partial [Myxococcales bacterium]|nr:peptidylprolyl isomerase [Myxococcales bacterium]
MRRLLPIALCLLCAVGVSAEDDAARRGKAIVAYEGGTVTVGELEDAIANKAPFLRPDMLTPEGRRETLRQLLEWELLVAEAQRRGYAEHPQVRELTQRRAVQLLKIDVMSAFEPDSLPADEVAAFYEKRKDLMIAKPLRRASYVKLETRQEAEQFRQSALRMDLDEFRRTAVRMDERGRGGELGYVDEEGKPGGNPKAEPLDLELTRAAYALKDVGEVSEPIPYQGGFLIMRLTARTPGFGQTLAQVEPMVREQLAEAKAAEAVEERVSGLRARLQPKLERGPLSDARIEFAPPP